MKIFTFFLSKRIAERGLVYSAAGASSSRVVHDKIVCLPPFLKRSVVVDNSYSRTTIALESNTLFSESFFLFFLFLFCNVKAIMTFLCHYHGPYDGLMVY